MFPGRELSERGAGEIFHAARPRSKTACLASHRPSCEGPRVHPAGHSRWWGQLATPCPRGTGLTAVRALWTPPGGVLTLPWRSRGSRSGMLLLMEVFVLGPP